VWFFSFFKTVTFYQTVGILLPRKFVKTRWKLKAVISTTNNIFSLISIPPNSFFSLAQWRCVLKALFVEVTWKSFDEIN
jgi:hypothetical protein